ncbi:hypothetical protein MRBLMI12_001742 [Microbacterium sp. LMI12-1-1.1]|uniref:hypothetical protein n=1 Tax=Microbacterium sp. LMI12-1-1.1 TaxID=3135225 RepID=UPI003446A409
MSWRLEREMRRPRLLRKPSLRRLELVIIVTLGKGDLKADSVDAVDRQFPGQPRRALSLVGDKTRHRGSKSQP